MFDFDTFDRSLGRMIREAAMLEFWLEQTVKVLCESPYGALLISGESSTRVLQVCKVLIDAHKEVPEEHRAEFKTMLTDTKAALDRRHWYVHGAIGWEGDGIPGNARSRRLKASQDFQPINMDDLNQLCGELNRLCGQAAYFLRLALKRFPHHLAEESTDD
ncbi:hypothetical protein GTY66_23665 [Streptomyces sp. SID8356]|nr:hypothetical protein [Streptomyces sp. SID8356]